MSDEPEGRVIGATVNEEESFEQWVARSIGQLEQRMDRLKRLEDDARIRDIENRLRALEGHPRRMDRLQPISADKIRRAEQEFSTNTRGPDILSMTNTQVGAFASEYNRGYIAGQHSMVEDKNAFESRILGDAESRVRQHMRGGSLPEITIAGVVQALRGDENYRGRFEDPQPWYSKPAEDMTIQDYSDGVYPKKDPTA